MGTSTGARPARIDDEAKRIFKKVLQANAQLKVAIEDALVFTAFMHDDPRGEFDQADRDKYSDLFMTAITPPDGLFGTIALLQPMQDVETGVKTPAQYVAEQTGYDATTYSKQFD